MFTLLSIVLGIAALLALFMAAFTSTSVTPTGTGQTLIDRGAGEGNHETHIVAFATTAVTVEVLTRLKRVTGVSFGYFGTPAATEAPLSCDETVSDFGECIVPAGGSMTIRRPAGTTSGLVISVTFYGY